MDTNFDIKIQDNRASFAPFIREDASHRGIKVNKGLEKIIKEIFSKVKIGKGTIRILDIDNKAININKGSAINWILKNDPTADPKSINKMKNKALIEKIAFLYMKKRADLGDADAQCKLGAIYARGKGVEKSFDEAFKSYQKPAQQGNPIAQFRLGQLYESGNGVERSHDEAEKLFKQALSGLLKAADEGSSEAKICLGTMYLDRLGVESDRKEALKWYLSAGEIDDPEILRNVGYLHSREEKPESLKKAFEYYKKAAEQGDALAQIYVAEMYLEGEGVKKSNRQSFLWLNKAAKLGNPIAQYKVGFSYEYIGMLGKAKFYYQKSIEQGNRESKFQLACLYLNPPTRMFKGKLDKGIELLKQSADQDYDEAQYKLGKCYETGLGVEASTSEAFNWYQKASQNGHEMARIQLSSFGDTNNNKDLFENIKKNFLKDLGLNAENPPPFSDFIKIYYAEARKRHPDKVGSDVAMAQLNTIRDTLVKELQSILGKENLPWGNELLEKADKRLNEST